MSVRVLAIGLLVVIGLQSCSWVHPPRVENPQMPHGFECQKGSAVVDVIGASFAGIVGAAMTFVGLFTAGIQGGSFNEGHGVMMIGIGTLIASVVFAVAAIDGWGQYRVCVDSLAWASKPSADTAHETPSNPP